MVSTADFESASLGSRPSRVIMTKIEFEEIYPGYHIKFDGYRKLYQWTALGPHGRIQDTDTREHALLLIKKEKENDDT